MVEGIRQRTKFIKLHKEMRLNNKIILRKRKKDRQPDHDKTDSNGGENPHTHKVYYRSVSQVNFVNTRVGTKHS